jgi:hypothetical protein
MDSESKKADRRVKDCRLLEILKYVHIPFIYNVHCGTYIHICLFQRVVNYKINVSRRIKNCSQNNFIYDRFECLSPRFYENSYRSL